MDLVLAASIQESSDSHSLICFLQCALDLVQAGEKRQGAFNPDDYAEAISDSGPLILAGNLDLLIRHPHRTGINALGMLVLTFEEDHTCMRIV